MDVPGRGCRARPLTGQPAESCRYASTGEYAHLDMTRAALRCTESLPKWNDGTSSGAVRPFGGRSCLLALTRR
jgi:hypothetical protein